ncbi:DEAD/DEAH box helicase family protein [Azospirillum ramasamyi]|uniref:Helicase ATP-binding domain-containing protein n=1 Tax=Azospirillum ramasamyi TaxID=682998 RepID=A0A2U9SF10_9PROT|nr:DEAD/DEAH box helicase family protein [Azospirillum ramasamyi]AWU98122.1 hypothetical protein DM194_27605 [Azospirillum ramasamyi]
MHDDPFRNLAVGVQALRRRVEALTLGIGGALGVAADPYPHQIATVRRILTDTTVRHLIADEVGLGKTVQALMVLNALRWQNRRHRAVILVPDRLVRQWQDECWTRCHCKAAVVGEHDDDAEAFVRIVRPQSLQSGVFRLRPDVFDLLVVDEPQTMPASVLADVERAAPDFRQILLLSATPGLNDPARRRQVMRIIEPERTGCAELQGSDPEQALALAEESALSRFPGARDGTAGADLQAALFRTFSRERRIIRARRAEWGRYLPERRYEQVSVPPLFGEVERVRLGMEWVMRTGSPEDARSDAWRMAQALHRGHGSARQSIASARSRRPDVDGRLAGALEASASSPGDSRFDALLDTLARIWAANPSAQVIVVAGDNPTIDFISQRLPRYFGSPESPLLIATLRRPTESSEDERKDVEAMHEQLADFSAGRAKVLLIGEWVQAGLNLQYFARNVVFYSAPWEPEAIDQLVGRLDRLRPNGLFKADRGEHLGRVRIWSLSQEGTIEARVVAGLDAIGVFRRPLPPMPPADAEEMRRGLEALAFGVPGGAMEAFEAMASRWDGEWATSQLLHLNPFTPAAAQGAYDQLQRARLPEPVLRQPDRDAPLSARAEDALRGWTNLMLKGRFFDLGRRKDHKDENIRFSTLWYVDDPADAPFPVPEMPVPELPDDDPAMTRPRRGNLWMSGHVPFLYRRRDLARPPRNTVNTDDSEKGGGRLLRFLDHGDALHDRLVDGFIEFSRNALGEPAKPQYRVVLFPPGHPILQFQGELLLVSVGWLDPGTSLLPVFDPRPLEEILGQARSDAQKASLAADISAAQDAWQADQRWLREHLPAALVGCASRLSGDRWVPVDRELAWEALKPFADDENEVCAKSSSAGAQTPHAPINKGLLENVRRTQEEFAALWSAPLAGLEQAVSLRLLQVEAESADRRALRQAEVERRRAEKAGQPERMWEGRVAAAGRRLAMAERLEAVRTGWLRQVLGRAQSPPKPNYMTLLMRPAPME